jgi:hypothetical protein
VGGSLGGLLTGQLSGLLNSIDSNLEIDIGLDGVSQDALSTLAIKTELYLLPGPFAGK